RCSPRPGTGSTTRRNWGNTDTAVRDSRSFLHVRGRVGDASRLAAELSDRASITPPPKGLGQDKQFAGRLEDENRGFFHCKLTLDHGGQQPLVRGLQACI